MSIEAMKRALEALEDVQEAYGNHSKWFKDRVDALRQAIEQAEQAHAVNMKQERVDETAKGEQEPVLWLKTWSDGSVSVLKTKSHAFADRELEPLYSAPPPRKPLTEWQPIETAPKTGRKVILFYLNRNKLPRTVMARWLSDEQAAEMDADDVGLEGGWYECIDNWDDYTEVAIHEGEPSHWMPLPAPPIEAAHGIGEKA